MINGRARRLMAAASTAKKPTEANAMGRMWTPPLKTISARMAAASSASLIAPVVKARNRKYSMAGK